MLLFWRPAALIRTAWRRLINSQGIHLQLNWSLCDANGSSAIPWSTPPQSSPCSIRLPVRGWSRRVRVSRGQSSTWCWRTYRTYFPFRCHHTQQFKQTHAYDWRQRRSVSKKNMFTSGSNNRCTYTYSLWWRKSRCEFPELFSIHPRLALLRNANFLLQVWVSRAQLFIEIALYSWGGKAPRLDWTIIFRHKSSRSPKLVSTIFYSTITFFTLPIQSMTGGRVQWRTIIWRNVD